MTKAKNQFCIGDVKKCLDGYNYFTAPTVRIEGFFDEEFVEKRTFNRYVEYFMANDIESSELDLEGLNDEDEAVLLDTVAEFLVGLLPLQLNVSKNGFYSIVDGKLKRWKSPIIDASLPTEYVNERHYRACFFS
jgi:hypothetical protein